MGSPCYGAGRTDPWASPGTVGSRRWQVSNSDHFWGFRAQDRPVGHGEPPRSGGWRHTSRTPVRVTLEARWKAITSLHRQGIEGHQVKPGGNLGPRWYCPSHASPTLAVVSVPLVQARSDARTRARHGRDYLDIWSCTAIPHTIFSFLSTGSRSLRRSPSGRCCLEAFPVQGEDRGIRGDGETET